MNQQYGYVVFYNDKRLELYATSLFDAKLKAIEQLKVPKSKQGLLAVMLAEKNDETVTHDPAAL